jgi:hypothetical protein
VVCNGSLLAVWPEAAVVCSREHEVVLVCDVQRTERVAPVSMYRRWG